MRLHNIITEGRQVISSDPSGPVSASINLFPAELKRMLDGGAALPDIIDRSNNTLHVWNADLARPADGVAALRVRSPLLVMLSPEGVEVETASQTIAAARTPLSAGSAGRDAETPVGVGPAGGPADQDISRTQGRARTPPSG